MPWAIANKCNESDILTLLMRPNRPTDLIFKFPASHRAVTSIRRDNLGRRATKRSIGTGSIGTNAT